MNNLYVYTLFDQKTGRPRCTGIKDGNLLKICDIYRPGAGKTIKKIDKTKNIIRKVLLKASSEKRNIVTSDFKSHIIAFDLPRDHRDYCVYDLHLDDIKPTNSYAKDSQIVDRVLEKMSTCTTRDYQRIIAQAAVVYQDMEDTGLLINHNHMSPRWSLKTFSGRSKSSGFNIQGLADPYHVTHPGGTERDVLIQFDWIGADIRVASIMSKDKKLDAAFRESDPYTTMMNELNQDSDEQISRDESKRYLLKSINSMDLTSVALLSIYPRLGKWISKCKTVANSGGSLETLLGRKFRLIRSKNELAVLNGVMQGSVAHAMQLVLRRVWDRLPGRIVADQHDGLIVTSAPDNVEIRAVIDVIAPIMLNPFEGVLDENPSFPLQVSIGKKWKKWKLHKIYRESGVINVSKEKQNVEEAENQREGCFEGQAEETEKVGENAV